MYGKLEHSACAKQGFYREGIFGNISTYLCNNARSEILRLLLKLDGLLWIIQFQSYFHYCLPSWHIPKPQVDILADYVIQKSLIWGYFLYVFS